MSAVTRWYFIRHAPVPVAGQVIYGASERDADTSETAVFAGLAGVLPHNAVWITSQLRRTHQTAAAIGTAGYGLPAMIEEPRFGEQSFGDWQGRTYAELEAEGAIGYHRFWLTPASEVPPGGESFVAVIERVRSALASHLGTHRGRDVVCVAHGGTIRAVLAVALGLDPERALAFSVANCSLTRLDHHHGQDGAADVWAVGGVNLRPGVGLAD